MTITNRVKQLREQSLNAKETLSSERAELLTAFYKQETGLLSTPVKRAKAFAYLLEHKTIDIYPGELIVGEKGPAPKTAPTFPSCAVTRSKISIFSIAAKRPPSMLNLPPARPTRKPSFPTGAANRCANSS